ncbi:MAG: radical SAM protein [Desulfotignum sp.]|nr:radical SAM protein [Desulfotignum sp.]
MTRLVHNDKIIRFILDISIKFKSNSNVSKPFVVFESGKYDFSDYKEEFDYLLKHSTSKEEYEKKLSDGLLKIESLKNEYGYFSKLRRDRSEKLISLASHHFLIDNKSSIGRNFPPVCVQLLVTNECTTHCKMCDHYKIKNDKGKLGTNDIKSIIDSIKFLGTKSIVISGGEPLSREDIFQILTYSTERKIIDRLNPNLKTEHPGLKVGLLTNGIKKGGSPLTETDCEIIKETCSWVQLSIDSFVDENYEKIRGKRYLGVAIESLKKLSNVGYKNLEVCYTIQKDNFQELLNFHDCINRIPSSIEIRFKFAHGPSKKQEFLCSSAELRQLVQSAPFREKRFNFNYLISMINSNYFDYDGLSNGMPLRNKMIEYKSLKYKCHALRLTCKIDHNGDVYPCCFLFDDNNSESNFRRDYFIGSLRTPSGNIMPPENDGSGNKLSELWFKSDKLEMLRSRLLPVDDEACTYCTRHFYQNEYMNRATEIFTELSDCGVAENIAQKTNFESIGNFWV